MESNSGKTSFQQGRRTFLKGSGLVAVGVTLAGELHGAAAAANIAQDGANLATGPQSYVDLVNVLQGTNSTFEYSRGNTLPLTALPFGMAHWTLQSRADSPWLFQPENRRIQGIRCTHQFTPWSGAAGDYGYATFLPFSGEAQPDPATRASSYRPEDARLTPYSIKLFLMRYRAELELVPTERCAMLVVAFDATQDDKTRGLLFDIPGQGGAVRTDPENRRILFASTIHGHGVPDNFATYYVLEFAHPWTSFEVKDVGDHRVGVVRFPPKCQIEVRIGTSFISFEQSALNLAREVGSQSISSLRVDARKRWNEHLGRIEVQGGSHDQCRTFYSCLYRVFLFPRIWHEPDAHGKMHHFSAFNGKVMPGVMYADHVFWDVYRAWYPLMTILLPDRLGEILQSWVNAYREGGWLPQSPVPGYGAAMTGSFVSSLFADAAVKSIGGYNLAEAYKAMRQQATTPGDPSTGRGRVGLELYLRYRYLPVENVHQAVTETVDAAYCDFCVAQVAKTLGKHSDQTLFLERSRNWKNVFDPTVKFMRGRKADGSWLSPFDPLAWGHPYVEGGAWQHRWDAPHDIPGLIAAVGGKAAAAKMLEEMMTISPEFEVGYYGSEIHEMSEMAAVPFGQYAHSNQPVHHLLYIFAHADRPDRTQFWVRKVLDELYTPDSFPGDEDTGSMSAWYILSALGFYPVCPGRPEYTLGSPLFSGVKLHLAGHKVFHIEAPGNGANTPFVRGTALNGQVHRNCTIDHNAIVNGGTLRFDMSAYAASPA